MDALWVYEDARGTFVPLLNPMRLGAESAAALQMSRRDIQRLRQESRPVSRRARIRIAFLPGALLVYFSLQATSYAIDYRWSMFALAVIACGLSLFGVHGVLRFRHGCVPELFVAAMFRRRRCPACAYDLRGVPEDDDGITICPECGAAWRLDGPSSSSPHGHRRSL